MDSNTKKTVDIFRKRTGRICGSCRWCESTAAPRYIPALRVYRYFRCTKGASVENECITHGYSCWDIELCRFCFRSNSTAAGVVSGCSRYNGSPSEALKACETDDNQYFVIHRMKLKQYKMCDLCGSVKDESDTKLWNSCIDCIAGKAEL